MKNELEQAMLGNLKKIASGVPSDLSEAAQLISTAMEIFDNCGMHSKSDRLLKLLNKIAKKPKDDILSEFDRVVDDEGIDDLLASDLEGDSHYDSNIDTDFEDEE